MNSEEIISLYEAVSDITDQMVVAAKNGDWDQLTALESRCAGHVNTLKQGEPPVALTGISREKKVKIIHKILADDREIRKITEPWMAKLASLMINAGAERKLAMAYGGNQAG